MSGRPSETKSEVDFLDTLLSSDDEATIRALMHEIEHDPSAVPRLMQMLKDPSCGKVATERILRTLTKAAETLSNGPEVLSVSIRSLLATEHSQILRGLLHQYSSSNRALATRLGDMDLVRQLLALSEDSSKGSQLGLDILGFLSERAATDLEVRESFLSIVQRDTAEPLARLLSTHALLRVGDAQSESLLVRIAMDTETNKSMRGEMISAILLSVRETPSERETYARLKPTIREILVSQENFEAGDYSRVLGTHQCLSGLAFTSPDPDLVPLYFALLDHSPHAGLRSLSVSLLARQMTSFGIEDRLIHVGFDPNNSGDLRDLALSELADKGTGISLKQMDQALADPALADSDRGKIQEYRDWLAGRLQTGK